MDLVSIITSGWNLTGLTLVQKQVMMEISLHAAPVKKTNGQVKAEAETKAEYLVDTHAYI